MDQNSIIFSGHVLLSMDEKFRISLSSTFCGVSQPELRSIFLFATCPRENCIIGMQNGYLPIGKEDYEMIAPRLFPVTSEKDGRITIPAHARTNEYFKQKGPKKVWVIGRGNYFEIRPHEKYNPEIPYLGSEDLIRRITENEPR